MQGMTSRERVIKATNFEEPDKVPIDWGMILISGIHEVAYRNLLKYLNIEEDIIILDRIQRLALPSERILQLFEVDTRAIHPYPISSWKYEEDEKGNWYDEFGIQYAQKEFYCDFLKYPLEDATSIEDLKKFKMPDPTDPSRFRGLREKAKYLYENTDKALTTGLHPSLYYTAWSLRGMEDFMVDTMTDPRFSNYLLDMITEWWIAYMDCYLKEIGDYIQIMWVGDDWGSQDGPLINPKIFKETVVPRFKKLISYMKTKSNAKVANHSCGSVLWAIDDFVEMGVNIIQPLQPNAVDMGDSERIKKLTYKKLVIHGGLDNQGKFNSTEEAVMEDVKNKMKAFAPGGGYLFASGHNIQADCPPENVLAIFNTAKKYRKYPINID